MPIPGNKRRNGHYGVAGAIRAKMWHPEGGASQTQKEFLSDFHHPTVCYFGGFGTGKSYCAAHKAIQLMIRNPGQTGGVVSHTYPLLKETLIPVIQTVLDECYEIVYENGMTGPVPYHFNKNDLKLTIPSLKAAILFKYASRDSLKGVNWRWGIGDEPGLWDEEAWHSFLSRVRVKVSQKELEATQAVRQIALTGTPEGYNWLYYETVGGEKFPGAEHGNNDFMRVWYASTRDAPWVEPSALEAMLRGFPKDLIAEKIDGKFLSVGKGKAYASFDRHKHVAGPQNNAELALPEYDPNYPITLSVDWGAAPIVAVIHQTRPDPDQINAAKGDMITYALDEIHFERGRIADVVGEFYSKWGERIKTQSGEQPHRVICTGDATGKAQHATGVISIQDLYDRMSEFGVAYVHAYPESNPPVSDRVAVTNRALEDGRYVIHPKCKDLIRSFELTFWSETNPGRKLEKKKGADETHLSDAASYDVFRNSGIGRIREARTYSGSAMKGGIDSWMKQAK